MKGHPIRYSAEEWTWLEANRAMVISDYHRAFCEAFGRADVSAVNLHSLRKRKGWRTGRTGCFVKGQEPVNKGKPCAPGTGGRHPNAQRTQCTCRIAAQREQQQRNRCRARRGNRRRPPQLVRHDLAARIEDAQIAPIGTHQATIDLERQRDTPGG